MSLQNNRFPEDNRLPKLFMMQWIQYVLDTCSSVSEVVSSARQIVLDGWNWHIMAADKQGDPHLHFLVTKGGVDEAGVDEAGVFHKVTRINVKKT